MTDVRTIVEQYIAVWNETDENKRRALIADVFTEGAGYTDPLGAVRGHDGIDRFVAGAQAQFGGLTFSLPAEPDAHHDLARFQWYLGTPAPSRSRSGSTSWNSKTARSPASTASSTRCPAERAQRAGSPARRSPPGTAQLLSAPRQRTVGRSLSMFTRCLFAPTISNIDSMSVSDSRCGSRPRPTSPVCFTL